MALSRRGAAQGRAGTLPGSFRKSGSDTGGVSGAGRRITAAPAAHQRFLALFGRSVGEAFGHDEALARPLQRVVADRRRGGHAFLEVARLHGASLARGPDAGIAICLELHPDLQRIAGAFARARLRLADRVGGAGDGLDVVADLVRDDIGLGKIAGRAVATGKLVEKLVSR